MIWHIFYLELRTASQGSLSPTVHRLGRFHDSEMPLHVDLVHGAREE